LEIPRGRDYQEPKFPKETMNKIWNFQGDKVGGSNKHILCGRGIPIFWKTLYINPNNIFTSMK